MNDFIFQDLQTIYDSAPTNQKPEIPPEMFGSESEELKTDHLIRSPIPKGKDLGNMSSRLIL